MKAQITAVTEKTLIPISLMIAIIGGVFWLTSLAYKTEANAKALDGMASLSQDIAVIRTKIERIEKILEAN